MSAALEMGIKEGGCLQVPGLKALGPFGALKQITVYSRQSSPQPTPGETDSCLPLGVPLRHTALPSSADNDAAP